MKDNRVRAVPIEPGCGNVFADLGIENAELALVKAKLVQRIRALIAKRKLSDAKASELLGLDRSSIAALIRGRVESYTIDDLFRLLNALGQRVEISIRPYADSAQPRAVVVI